MSSPIAQRLFAVRDYDLAATLASGQAFRWQRVEGWWEGVVDGKWVRLRQGEGGIEAEAVVENPKSQIPNPKDVTRRNEQWMWLADYLQIDVDLKTVLRTFPDDEPMRAAM